MKKRIVHQEELELFLEKLKKLKNIDDIDILKSQLDKAIMYYNTNILNKEKYTRNELLHIIYELSQSKNKHIDTEKHFALYKEIKNNKNLSIDEIITKWESI